MRANSSFRILFGHFANGRSQPESAATYRKPSVTRQRGSRPNIYHRQRESRHNRGFEKLPRSDERNRNAYSIKTALPDTTAYNRPDLATIQSHAVALCNMNCYFRPSSQTTSEARRMNDLLKYADLFEDIVPWSGIVPNGFTVDFLGTRTRKRFLELWGWSPLYIDGAQLDVPRPALTGKHKNCEFWFEAADWVLAAREARGKFVMATLGALYGYQAVGSFRALQRLSPMPCKLVAVEPIPENMERVRLHMRDNGIDPDRHWLVEAAISDSNDPILFPVGSPGLGAQNCIATDERVARQGYLEVLVDQGRVEEALENILLHNTTGLEKEIIAGEGHTGEIKFVSSITLKDILGPFDRIDFVEADIQQSEINVFPPFVELLRRKVRRIHLGTHGQDTHVAMRDMFADEGWEIVFSFEPDSEFDTPLGGFKTNDGILTVVNPRL